MSILAVQPFNILFINEGRLWGAGANIYGQLHLAPQPLGHNLVTKFAPITLPALGPDERIAHVASGAYHAVFITTAGRLWGAGDNDYGQLGLGHTQKQGEFAPIPLPAFGADERIAHLACGADHTVFITTAGRLWGAGDNHQGQLGLGDTQAQREFIPIPLPALGPDERIAHVASNYVHTIFITTEGSLWGAGQNQRGQLGLGHTQEQREFVPIPALSLREDERIAHVASGAAHTVFITTEGRLWGAGYNHDFQLGLGHTREQHEFVLIPAPALRADERIAHLACGAYHTVFITTAGRLWGAGDNNYGQLGLGHTQKQGEFVPIPLPALGTDERIAYVACSEPNTVFITTKGGLYGAGAGYDDNGLNLQRSRKHYAFVLFVHFIRSPLVPQPSSLKGLDSEYENLITKIYSRFTGRGKIIALFIPYYKNSLTISALIQKDWSRLKLETGTLSQKEQLSYLQLFYWLRLSMTNPKLANSLTPLLHLTPEHYLVTKGYLAEQGVPVNIIPGSAHNPVPIYHLPILPSGRETILLSHSPIIIGTAQNNTFDISHIPPPPRQLLDLPQELLGIILDFLDPIDRVNLMNTCRTTSNMYAVNKSLMAPLAISVKRSDYVHAQAIIAPHSAVEASSFETIVQIDALLQDIYMYTENDSIFRLKKLLLAGQVSLVCLLDLHQRLYNSTEKLPTLPPFKVLEV
jgi:alpha-tubulin suppressor-like RCC1 family protein